MPNGTPTRNDLHAHGHQRMTSGRDRIGGRGAKALAFARAQLGKPYRFGASGPNAYDCSGLTGAAWRPVGVSLPRTSQHAVPRRPRRLEVRAPAR